ncbi:MAG: hypothetical protein H0W99_15870, partial [Acidobacteria bacterium]|nr:hypothetical protein [Acidobacteriota bacterium]
MLPCRQPSPQWSPIALKLDAACGRAVVARRGALRRYSLGYYGDDGPIMPLRPRVETPPDALTEVNKAGHDVNGSR